RAGDADVFIACAGDDENNIMSCVEAKTLGAAVAVAVVSHSDYADVVGKLGIDETVSPYDVIERQVEGLTRQGALIFQNSRLLGGDVEVVELEVEEGSPITRAPLRDLRVPKPTLIAGVARENAALTPSPDFIFRPNDCAVALAMRENLATLVKMFEKG
ncbi:MAG: NAD-binding protein, partial [Thermoguttaceae bacterium]|nr:NAD-binding protein [Thermoguttaceae bacterium]